MQIALVDGSRTVRKAVSQMLEGWGYHVTGLSDHSEALDYLRQHEDVRTLIISSELPSGPGAKLCNEARKLCAELRPLYVLLMSSERGKLVAALEAGADDFISKPPSVEELKARLRTAERVTRMQADLIRRAVTDSLTGAMTRRRFFEKAAEVWPPNIEQMSVLVCDLDHFKDVNDTYGHQVGDHLLRVVAQEILGFGEWCGRLGGEEFAILSPVGLKQALQLGERVRQAIAHTSIPADGSFVRPTCSIGIADYKLGDTIDTLLRKADLALYEAKRTGRNRIVTAGTFMMTSAHATATGVTRSARRGQAH